MVLTAQHRGRLTLNVLDVIILLRRQSTIARQSRKTLRVESQASTIRSAHFLSVITDCLSSFCYWPVFQSHFLEPAFYITGGPRSDGGLGWSTDNILNRGCNWTNSKNHEWVGVEIFRLGPGEGEKGIFSFMNNTQVSNSGCNADVNMIKGKHALLRSREMLKRKPHTTISEIRVDISWRFIPMNKPRLGHYIWITRLRFAFG